MRSWGQSLPGRGTLSLPMSSPRTQLRQEHFARLHCGPAGEPHNQRPCSVKELPSARTGDRVDQCRGMGQRECDCAHSSLVPWPSVGPGTWQDLRKPLLIEWVRFYQGLHPNELGPFPSSLPLSSPPLSLAERAPAKGRGHGHRLPLLA